MAELPNNPTSPSASAPEPAAPASPWPLLWRALALVAVLVGAALLLRYSPWGERLAHGESLKDLLTRLGGWAPAAFVVAGALASVLGFPRTMLCLVGGMVFGVGGGLAWAMVASLLGAYATFLLADWWLGGERLRQHRLSRKLAELLQRRQTIAVVLARQIPLHASAMNVLLALARVRHGPFLVGSLIGYLPQALVSCSSAAG